MAGTDESTMPQLLDGGAKHFVSEKENANGHDEYSLKMLLAIALKAGRRKDMLLIVVGIALLTSLGMNSYLYFRKADLLVAVTTPDGRRVVSINNRDYGTSEPVQLGRDNLSNDDKKYLASQFIKLLYGIDPASRQNDLERALRLMLPGQAVKYAGWLKQSGVLEQQRNEKWQAVWNEQSVKVDPNDPYLVHIVGEQKITKTIGEQISQETVQWSLDIKLVADAPRSDRNIRTGFLVATFSGQELNRSTSKQQ